ncbi:Zn(II)2Cys6 transcription factor domain-containing protein [Aspergillus lucknowensis]|uniref:Zn(2)-C6 fungal-type domain-containing protein n=1 Tax=Aspergillus lucknowensis TaxID=176173 RepID=A0ABR4LRL2_9EURO
MVHRSSGCLLCVKRRVKCDERVPGCVRCETYGKPCPGYERGFKFVAGKPYRSPRRPKSSNQQGQQSRASSTSDDSQPATDYEFTLVDRAQPSSLGLGNLNLTQCLNTLTDEISQPFPTTSGYVISRWFLFLPSIYGRNKTLDSAMKAFVAHHVGNVTLNQKAVLYGRSAYGEALGRLRKSLNVPSEYVSSEIYCSVLLLCLYELFTNTDRGDVWMSHARALSQLTKARGPSFFQTELDNILLKASRGLIVMHSLFGGDECFLASNEWHRVMKQQHNPGLSLDFDNLLEDFFAYFTLSPGLVHKLYSLKEADFTNPTTLVEMSEMLKQSLELLEKLVRWYDKFCRATPLPYQALSSRGDTVYPIVLLYSNINSATIYCAYYSYMVLIHEILRTCGYPGEHGAMVAHFRDQICMSVEYTAQGLLGPYRMGLPLRVAYEVADTVAKEWIRGCLKTFSEFYAVLCEQNF